MVSDPPPPEPRQRQISHGSPIHRAAGRPPTRADLARAMGLRNRQGIDQHLRALERKGYLELEPGIARACASWTARHRATHCTARHMKWRAARCCRSMDASPPACRLRAGQHRRGNFDQSVAVSPRADFLLRVHGQSMRDAGIAHRDILAVHRTARPSMPDRRGELNEEAT